ncbi:MAG: cobalamin-dependent protein [Clostridiaceae bacterium]
MSNELLDFIKILETENREEALRFLLKIKVDQNLSVLQIYEDYLTPALNHMTPTDDQNIDIWKEHVRTSIIKTIIENMLPYLKAESKPSRSTPPPVVAVLCPPEEYHDVGARMAADILTMAGFQTIFVGGNTPYQAFKAGLSAQPIDYIAISISNPYHLVSARRIIDGIRSSHPQVKIIVGGNAILKHPDIADVIKADFIATTLNDLAHIDGGDRHVSI